jgi:hypothetical protein
MGVNPDPVRHDVPAPAPPQPTEQLLYAQLLDWGARLGFVVLVLGFAVYLSGWVDALVPLEQLPQLWNQPAAVFLQRTGQPAGWGWLRLLHKADVANLLGIALLAGCSLPPLLAAMAHYLTQRARVHALLCAGVVAVVLLAASGLLGGGH